MGGASVSSTAWMQSSEVAGHFRTCQSGRKNDRCEASMGARGCWQRGALIFIFRLSVEEADLLCHHLSYEHGCQFQADFSFLISISPLFLCMIRNRTLPRNGAGPLTTPELTRRRRPGRTVGNRMAC